MAWELHLAFFMGRLKTAWAAGAATALAVAAAGGAALWASPSLAVRLSDVTLPWPLGLAVQAALVILITGGLLCLLPRRVLGAALAGLSGAVAGLSILVLAFPPALRWADPVPAAREAAHLLLGHSPDWAAEEVVRVTVEEDAVVAHTSWGSRWSWNLRDGRLRERRGPRDICWTDFYPGVEPRELPVEPIREGVPIPVFLEPKPVVRVAAPLRRKIVFGRGGRRGYVQQWSVTFWDVKDLEPVLTVTSPSSGTLSPDGKWIFITTCYDRRRPVPGLRSQMRGLQSRLGTHGRVYDVERRKVAWDRWFENQIWPVDFSPRGTYLVAGGELLDAATGKTLGPVDSPDIRWLEGEKFLLLKADPGVEVRRVPDLTPTSDPRDLPYERWAISPDGCFAAFVMGDRVRVVTFPNLWPVRDHFMATLGWILDLAALAGLAAGLFFGIMTFFLRGAPADPGKESPRPSGWTWGAVAVVAYLALLPGAAFTTLLPLDLPDGPAALSLILVVAAASTLAWISFRRPWARITACLLIALTTGAALFAAFIRAREPVAPMPEGADHLVDERWAFDSSNRALIEIGSGKVVGRLDVEVPDWGRYRRQGGNLIGQFHQGILEWNPETLLLERAYLVPVDEMFAGLNSDRGAGEEGAVVPLLTLFDLFQERNAWDRRPASDGSLVFSMDRDGEEWVYRTRLGGRSYLEIPLQAAAGAIFLVGFLALMPRRPGTRR